MRLVRCWHLAVTRTLRHTHTRTHTRTLATPCHQAAAADTCLGIVLPGLGLVQPAVPPSLAQRRVTVGPRSLTPSRPAWLPSAYLDSLLTSKKMDVAAFLRARRDALL